MCACIHFILTDNVFTYVFPHAQTGATPLYIASEKGHTDVVNILIKGGADVNLARNV